MKRLSYFLTLLFSLSVLPAQAVTLTATKTVGGQPSLGATVTYTVVITNTGATAQADNPGDEFTDNLPFSLLSPAANATSGTAVVAGAFPPIVTWNGALAAGASVTITITATVDPNFGGVGTQISNQGTVSFDGDDNGTNESTLQTDDPSLPGASDPTVFLVERKGAGSARPAATLLLPYFEVDPVPNFPAASIPEPFTVLTVGNAQSDAVLTRVTVWTDYGLPTLSFHLYLTGYDIETIDLRQLFDGVLPRSADAGEDQLDNISNQGSLSKDINFGACTGIFNATRPPSADIVGLRRAHSGLSSSLFGNQCASRNHGDGILRGYITIDAVNACDDTLLPNDAGYESLLTGQNLLWGSYSSTDPAQNFAESGTLVHLKHETGPLSPTFYQRFNGDTTREALGSVWGTRYLNGGPSSASTVLRVWREPRTKPVPVACATTAPAFLPGRQVQIVAFDEEENPTVPGIGAQPFAQPFPLVTQQVEVDGAALPLPSDFGWLYLNLNHGSPAQASQSYVSVVHDAEGRFRVSNGAVMIQSGLGQIQPVGSDLFATKAVTGQFGAGGTVTYTVEISSVGDAPLQNNAGAEFTDVLPTQLTLVSATATSGAATATVATNTVTWNGELATNARTTVTITAKVKSPLAVGTVVSNQGQLSCDSNANGTNEPCGNTDDPNTTEQFNDPTIFLVGGGNRALPNGTKTVVGQPFLAGGNVVYTVVLRNVGTGTLLDDAGDDEFFDPIPSLLTFQSVTATSGTATNSGNQVMWNGTLAPNATVTLTIRAQINPAAPTGSTVANQGTMRYDTNGDGTTDATKRTDDPNTPFVGDPTVFTVGP